MSFWPCGTDLLEVEKTRKKALYTGHLALAPKTHSLSGVKKRPILFNIRKHRYQFKDVFSLSSLFDLTLVTAPVPVEKGLDRQATPILLWELEGKP